MTDPFAFATPHLGPILLAQPVDGFVGNQTFHLRTSDGVYYLKQAETAAEEARACKLATTVGAPAPTVVAQGPGYLITRALAGRPPAAEDAAVLRVAGQAVRAVHSLSGESVSWATHLRTVSENLTVLPPGLQVRYRELIPPFVDSVAGVQPVLLHGDLHLRHLYADGDRLTGILDWGDTTYGDPLFDLARFSMAGPVAMAAFVEGYGGVDAPERTLSCYRVLWSLMALQAEHLAGGDWLQPHIDRIAAELS
ncbi:phosphotransferase family protein [Kribbella sp. WER1]